MAMKVEVCIDKTMKMLPGVLSLAKYIFDSMERYILKLALIIGGTVSRHLN